MTSARSVRSSAINNSQKFIVGDRPNLKYVAPKNVRLYKNDVWDCGCVTVCGCKQVHPVICLLSACFAHFTDFVSLNEAEAYMHDVYCMYENCKQFI